MKTSINFKAVKSDSEIHNFRKKTFDYIRKDLTSQNEYWLEQKIVDRIQKIENYCKEKSGRKLQKNALPIREAVVVIKENTTLQDLHNLSKRLEKELGIRVFQIAIHRDEGHYDKDSKEWKPNLHAHLVADWQDLQTGKTLKHHPRDYSKMQDITAECLEMERGISGSRARLEAIEFKIQKKEEELKALEEKIEEMKNELSSTKSEDLIVMESDFLGFQHIKTDKTIENYKKKIKIYNAQILKNKAELEAKTKQITELQNKTDSLKKEINTLKNKNSLLLSNPNIFAGERKKYLDSVLDTLEKSIMHERFRNPNKDRADSKILIEEMSNICEKTAKENNIPFSALDEILKDSGIVKALLFLLKGGSQGTNNDISQEENLQKSKKRRLR
ncbi:plasmid recombination protein [Chryseobacterium rhizoplanae]|uniref:plasmid recombination protein n=1 Tax=Chryseobacterium rhizoplanae TaxID=1609531 RepID=UPI001CE38F79|nr:plasmid recombination protein [Chryseobacterium rhizoplanae]UCA58260.1 plasmid recombination protein [Chryseobacterium rhizoplanae]